MSKTRITLSIWVQGIIYWVHEFEEYVAPGRFLKFFNNNTMRCTRDDYPMTDVGSFWINIPLVYIAMPFSAVLAHFFGLEWGIWTALFSVLNGLGHVGFWAIFGTIPDFVQVSYSIFPLASTQCIILQLISISLLRCM